MGRGLEALIPTLGEDAAAAAFEIDIDAIAPNPYQPRIEMGQEALPGTYDIKVRSKPFSDRGIYQLSIDAANFGSQQDEYQASTAYVEKDLGNYYFSTAGNKQFKFQVVGKNASCSGYTLLLD